MIITLNFNFLKEISSSNYLTYFALMLAYNAYVWSVNRDLESWKSLFISFKNDLENQKSWLMSEYFSETYKDKYSYSPGKIIYPLSFESLPEIIRRGVSEFSWIKSKFAENLSIFNERIIAFNSTLDHVKKVVSSDPIKSEELILELEKFCICKKSLEFDDLKRLIDESKDKNELFHLANHIHRLNKMIHVNIIGNKNSEDKLNYLYHEIIRELENILVNFNKRKPWFVRYSNILGLLSLVVFFILEIILK